jgi:hypothetical protein
MFNKAKKSVGRDSFLFWGTEMSTLCTHANWDVQHQNYCTCIVFLLRIPSYFTVFEEEVYPRVVMRP